jgi:hypothetical protein
MVASCTDRLKLVIDEAWNILFSRIVSGRQKINKEASLQLQLARIINELGNTYCLLPNEVFNLELEASHQQMNIDITCTLGTASAAIELKCFIKSSNRAKDLDMYDALKDIERLHRLEQFDVKTFICLTDNPYYPNFIQRGMASSVTLRNGTRYLANMPITPAWTGKWNVKRDSPILFLQDVECNWKSVGNWHYMRT